MFTPQPRRFATALPQSSAVSVVMTSWRDKRFVRTAVASVLAQSFADFELIVVDDGSPDPGAVEALALSANGSPSLWQLWPRIRN